MIGSDESSGEEEVLENSNPPPQAQSAAAPAWDTPQGAVVSQLVLPPPDPLGAAPEGWTEHRSVRYRDGRQPSGYIYYFNPLTGETRWAANQQGPEGATTGAGGRGTKSLWYSSLPMAPLPAPELERLIILSDGYLKVTAPDAALYYCDQQKREKWAFHTNRFGLEILCHMLRENQPALAECHRLIAEKADTEATIKDAVKADGRQIYTEKKHLIAGVEGHKKVTWSQDEYAHPGMQLMYLSLKSWQRFTETWALLERAARLGLFEPHRNHKPEAAPAGAAGVAACRPVRCVSIGGGPGYELLAFERFFRQYACDRAPLQLVSLDLMPGWRPFVEAMGMQVITWIP